MDDIRTRDKPIQTYVRGHINNAAKFQKYPIISRVH